MIRRIRLFDIRDYIFQLPQHLHTELKKKKKESIFTFIVHHPAPRHRFHYPSFCPNGGQVTFTQFIVSVQMSRFETQIELLTKPQTYFGDRRHHVLLSCKPADTFNHFYWPTNALNCIKLKG